MSETVSICPICSHTELEHYLTTKDYTTTQEEFELQRCKSCDFVLTSPRPDEASIGKYYESDKYISHTGGSASLFDKAYLIARKFALNRKLKLISQYQTKGSVLDYGCGTGEFLNHMKTHGWTIAGVEPSATARTKASLLAKVDVTASINNVTEKYNAVTLWHVLEHVHDIREKLAAIVSHLQTGGTLFIAVPNHESPDAEKYKEYWAAYDVPRHLWHFTKQDMTQLLSSLGLKIVAIEPMKMDAYYVSMLSEQYRNPNKNKIARTISAAFSGMMSNIKASKTTNHSSLIYIAQR